MSAVIYEYVPTVRNICFERSRAASGSQAHGRNRRRAGRGRNLGQLWGQLL